MKNNKGFSLVEMIVTISVLMIIIIVVALNFGNVYKWQLNKCVENIDDNLNKIKVMTLSDSQNNSTLNLSQVDGSLYMSINGNEDIDMGKFNVTVYFEDINRDNEGSMELSNQEVTISFNNNGEFEEISELSGMYLKRIVVAKGSYTKEIICERLTGKHYILK